MIVPNGAQFCCLESPGFLDNRMLEHTPAAPSDAALLAAFMWGGPRSGPLE